MARPLKGAVRAKPLADGETVAYYARVRQKEVLLGYSPQWTRTRAERELAELIIPKAKLGMLWWTNYTGPALPDQESAPLTFHEIASEYVAFIRARHSNENTRKAYLAPVIGHLLPYFAYHDKARKVPRLASEVDGFAVTAFEEFKKLERLAMCELADSLADGAHYDELDPTERELMDRYGQQHQRTGTRSLSSRGLSNNEINRCLSRLADIYRLASRNHKIDLGDPSEGHRLPKTDPPRNWLRPHHLQAIFDAAQELDAVARWDYAENGRYAAVVVLALTGLRVSEFARMLWQHVLFGDEQIFVPKGKTPKSRRAVDMLPLVEQVLRERHALMNPKNSDLVFPTATGKPRDRNSVRTRLLEPVLIRAEELLEERNEGLSPDCASIRDGRSAEGAQVTAHTFRRTFLTYLGWAGWRMRHSMKQAGHASSKLTVETYQQDTPRKLDPRVVEWVGRPESDDEKDAA
jgi:integrase